MSDTRSIWQEANPAISFPEVTPKTHFDIAIIGGGIAGISTAHNLRDSGLRVAVIEARKLLQGVTGHTTGKLTSQHGIIYHDLIKHFGRDHAARYAEMNEWAIREVRRMAVEENLECDYISQSAYVYAMSDETADKLAGELQACMELGLPATLEEPDLPYKTKGAIKFQNQARYHPIKYLFGLIERMSPAVSFYEGSRVTEIEETDSECKIKTELGEITADKVVVSTHYPIYDSGLFVAKLAPYKSYAIAVEVNHPMPTEMVITEDDPLRSMRRQPIDGRDVLIVGGGHHKVGQQQDAAMCFSEIARWADEHYGVKRLLYKWSTQDNWTPDRLPYIGKSPRRDRIFVATGFGGWGMTTGIAAGRILADLLQDIENPWGACVDPARLSLGAVPTMAKENLNAASHLIGDRLGSADTKEFDSIPIGDAAIVQLPDERVAAYRDHDGNLHIVTSACTHWGCEVRWNSAETTWDCPCHGSRFTIDGHVLHSPAVKPLEKRSAGL